MMDHLPGRTLMGMPKRLKKQMYGVISNGIVQAQGGGSKKRNTSADILNIFITSTGKRKMVVGTIASGSGFPITGVMVRVGGGERNFSQ
jgi:hypothetical protein